MTWAIDLAAGLPEGSERVLFYNLAEHVANGLGLYVYTNQPLGPVTFASWIDPSSVDTCPIFMGSPWFELTGNGLT
jgi:hypothetical protein